MTLPIKVAFVLNMLVAVAATWASDVSCQAGEVDRTVHAWKRTWHAYNAFDRPLRPYFIPRWPGDCAREAYYRPSGCSDAAAAAMGLQPVGLERLGHIPNDFSVDTAAAGR